MTPPRAPKLHAWLTRKLRFLVMDRQVWHRAKPPRSERVLFQLDESPMQGLAASGVYATAQPITGPEFEITVFRPDPNDAAKGFPINTDHYRLWEGFPSHLDLHRLANQATTSVDPNLLAYGDERVFLVKDAARDDHWLVDYPPEVLLLIEQSKRR